MIHKYRISAACISTAGATRFKNEDGFLFNGKTRSSISLSDPIVITSKDHQLGQLIYGVFDGIGGMVCGEKASQCASSYFSNVNVPKWLKKRKQELWLKEKIQQCNIEVGRLANELSKEIGTTAALVLFYGTRAITANVGDSRVYLCRDGDITRLSIDHTDEDFLVSIGASQRKPSLMQYLGMPDRYIIEPSFATVSLSRGDIFLCCSDGITSTLSDCEINDVITHPKDIVEVANDLVDSAIEKGSKDNITIIVCKVI